MFSTLPPEIQALSVPERIQLAQLIWDSVAEEDFELSDAQKAELERRLKLHHADPSRGETWEEVEKQLRVR